MLKVSVMTSVYSCAKYLETCIQAVKGQTYGEVEHILVNMGSPESEMETEIINRLSHKNLFYCAYPQHGNLTQAWNRAIYFAQGDLIMNLNSDDCMTPEAVAIMAGYFEEDSDLGLAYSDLVCRRDDGSEWGWRKPDWKGELFFELCGPAPMWRKSLHKKLGMMDETFLYVADFDWWLRVSHHSKLKRVPQFLVRYAERADSLEHRGWVGNKQQDEREVVVKRFQDGYYVQPFH